jgi:glycosyltransferase involved in cell wall biosynthesis
MALPEGEATGVVRRTGCGVCVPPEDPAALAAAIVALREDPARLAGLANASAKAAPGFSRQAQADLMLEILARMATLQAKTR